MYNIELKDLPMDSNLYTERGDIDTILFLVRLKELQEEKFTGIVVKEVPDMSLTIWATRDANPCLTSAGYALIYEKKVNKYCPVCLGTGQDNPEPGKYRGICSNCKGTGKVPEE